MTNESSTIVQRLWNDCNVLCDDGMSYGDYLEQLTYLLFLKMDDKNEHQLQKPSAIPPEYNWASLRSLSGDELESHYRQILTNLGQGAGLISAIFRKAQNKIQDPSKLERLVELMDGETWIGLDIDVKGNIRGAAGKERPGHQIRDRAVFHPARAHPGHRGVMRDLRRGKDLKFQSTLPVWGATWQLFSL